MQTDDDDGDDVAAAAAVRPCRDRGGGAAVACEAEGSRSQSILDKERDRP